MGLEEAYRSIGAFPREFDGVASSNRLGEGGECNAAFNDCGEQGGAESECVGELHLSWMDRLKGGEEVKGRRSFLELLYSICV